MTPPDDLVRRKEELETSLDRYGTRSRVFGVLVVIGLTIEFVAIVFSFFYEAASRIVDACGLLLVTIGVAGEIKAEFDSHRAEHRLRDVNAKLSEIAEEKIRQRDRQVEILRKENNETAIFLGDRRIIDPMGFQQAMHQFAGTAYMILAEKDRESQTFALSLRYHLEASGWVLNQFADAKRSEGVTIVESGFDDPGPCSDAGEALADALNGIHIAALTCLQNQAPSWAMTIMVGRKPDTIDMQNRLKSERVTQKERRSGNTPKRTGGPLSPNR